LPSGRIGIMSDLHGNPTAVRAVLSDGHAQGVEQWIVLGDVVAMGSDPTEVMSILETVSVIATVSGNTERYVLTDERPEPTFDQVEADPTELPRLVEVAASFAWTRGYLAGAKRLAELRAYSRYERFSLPDRTRVLAVHASLVSDEGLGINPHISPDDVLKYFPDHAADMIIGGHTHQRTDQTLDGVRFMNPGSVSNHPEPAVPARYSIIDVDPTRHDFEHRDVAYDQLQAAADISSCGIPGADFLLRRYFPGS